MLQCFILNWDWQGKNSKIRVGNFVSSEAMTITSIENIQSSLGYLRSKLYLFLEGTKNLFEGRI